jgi:hypothetical protein
MKPAFAATAPLTLALFLAACGSVTGIDDLFQDSSGAGGTSATTGQGGSLSAAVSGSGGAVGTTGVSASSGPSTTGGPTTTSGPTTTGQGTTGPGGPGSSSVTGPSSTGPGGPSSTGPGGPGSTSSGGPTNTVYCNNAPCNAGQICCFNLKQPTDKCGPPGSCGDGFIELECNGPEDCPGGVCCADVDYSKNPPYKGISCQQSCNNPNKNLIVCSADSDCGFGKQCEQSQTLGQGYKVCK